MINHNYDWSVARVCKFILRNTILSATNKQTTMFSSIFGKRRSSPVEENENPPIPGARSDDGFVIVSPTNPAGGGLYPSVNNIQNPGSPYPYRPAPPLPVPKPATDNFHYLQGVPFSLCKELQLAATKDTYTIEIGDLLAFFMNKINVNKYDYNFSVEKSVLKEI